MTVIFLDQLTKKAVLILLFNSQQTSTRAPPHWFTAVITPFGESFLRWCGRSFSNPHDFRHWYLKPALSKMPPLTRRFTTCFFISTSHTAFTTYKAADFPHVFGKKFVSDRFEPAISQKKRSKQLSFFCRQTRAGCLEHHQNQPETRREQSSRLAGMQGTFTPPPMETQWWGRVYQLSDSTSDVIYRMVCAQV